VIEAGVWCAAALLLPAASAWALAIPTPGRIGRMAEWLRARPWVPVAAEWLHGFAFVFGALMRGAIVPRLAGLSGHSGAEWIGGTAIAGGVCLLVFVASRLVQALPNRRPWPRLVRMPASVGPPEPVPGLLEESRWALYRGAGGAWTGSLWASAGIGLGLAVVEAGLRDRMWENPAGWVVRRAGYLAHAGLSFVLFGLTRNAWLTALAFVICLFTWRRRRPGAGGPAPQTGETQ
jgi:hypothetical protein